MDLRLTDEQVELVRSFAQLLAKESPPERVREAAPIGHDPVLWRSLTDVGIVTMGVPESAGGWGADLVDLALVAERIGAALAAAPVIEAQVAARLLAAVGQAETLGDGDRLVVIALRPPVNGLLPLVPGGSVGDAVVSLEGQQLVLYDVADEVRRPVNNLGDTSLADIAVHEDGLVLASGSHATAAYERAIDEWLVLCASMVVGAAMAALDIACAYARERSAFGEQIGRFQAVAHPLADDATALDGAQLLVRKAAWSLERDDDRARELASMAFAFASRVGEKATYDAVHVHGGYGFMLEYDVQLHYRRARAWARVWGDAAAADRRAATARYGMSGGGR